MTLVHGFVLYVTGYEKDIYSSSDGFVPFALKGEGGSSKGEFEGYYNGSLGEIAVYPSSSAVTFDGSALNVALPSQYTYSKGETHALMQARINGDLVDFRHLAALLKVDVNVSSDLPLYMFLSLLLMLVTSLTIIRVASVSLSVERIGTCIIYP